MQGMHMRLQVQIRMLWQLGWQSMEDMLLFIFIANQMLLLDMFTSKMSVIIGFMLIVVMQALCLVFLTILAMQSVTARTLQQVMQLLQEE